MKYSIVIPTYNHCDDLLKPCIESIFKYTSMSDVELIVVANGCTDSTKWYLESLSSQFSSLGLQDHFKTVWSDTPLGYSGANNKGIQAATSDLIVLLNNDTVLIDQERDTWIKMLASSFDRDPDCGVSCVVKKFHEHSAYHFAVFFCVMIARKVFDQIGLLNEEYGKGGGEDVEFSIEAERAGFNVIQCMEKTWSDDLNTWTGIFPIYHKGEGTVHDPVLVPDWNDVFLNNNIKLSLKYNPDWYARYLHGKAQEQPLQPPVDIMERAKQRLDWIRHEDNESEELYREVFLDDVYRMTPEVFANREVIDIGANVGTFSLLAAELGAKHVWAVEPTSSISDKLNERIKRAGLETTITPVRLAAYNMSGSVLPIYQNTQSGHNNAYVPTENYELVPTISLEDLITKTSGNDLVLKIDCEGGEWDVLYPFSQDIVRKFVRISIEIHGHIHPLYKDISLMQQKLELCGFTLVHRSQMAKWDYDQQGNMINYEHLPMTIENWDRID